MLRAARLAVSVIFFASGAAYGNFVARIPALKEKLEASDAELGIVLFAGAAGAVVVLPIAGWLSARLGSRRVTRVALLGVALSLPLLAVAPTLFTFALAFAFFGGVQSGLDVAMNAHGVAVEERYARPIFSSFHASWSLGGLAGAGAGAAAAGLGVSPLVQFSAAAVVVAAIFAWSAGGLLPRDVDATPAGAIFGRPSGALVALLNGSLAGVAIVVGGAVLLAWSVLRLRA